MLLVHIDKIDYKKKEKKKNLKYMYYIISPKESEDIIL